MKKSSFTSMVLGTVAGILFALGMCMCLLPQWDLFKEGIITGAAGLVLGLVTVFVWRRMEHKAPVKFSARAVFLWVYSLLGALILGCGMCLCLIWEKYVPGTLTGIVGIVMLLGLIPIIRGIHN